MKLNKYYAIDPFSFLAKDVAWMFVIRQPIKIQEERIIKFLLLRKIKTAVKKTKLNMIQIDKRLIFWLNNQETFVNMNFLLPKMFFQKIFVRNSFYN